MKKAKMDQVAHKTFRVRIFEVVRQKAPKVSSTLKITILSKKVQPERHAHSPFKSPLGRNVPSIESRLKQALIPRCPISEEAIVFNVDNDSDHEHPIGSLKQGGTTSRTSSPSFNRGGL